MRRLTCNELRTKDALVRVRHDCSDRVAVKAREGTRDKKQRALLSSLLMTAHSSSSSPKDRMGAFFFFAPFAAASASAGAFAASAMGRFPARDCDGFAGGPIAGPSQGRSTGRSQGRSQGRSTGRRLHPPRRPPRVPPRWPPGARASPPPRRRALRVFRLSRHRARRRSRVRPSCFCAAGRLFGAARPAPPPGSPRAPPCAARSRLCASGPWGWRRRRRARARFPGALFGTRSAAA